LRSIKYNESGRWYFGGCQSFIGIDAASMAVRPNYCNCVISFLFYLAGIDFGVYFFLFDEKSPAQLVDTACASTGHSKSVGIDHLLYSLLFDNYLPVCCVVEYKHSLCLLLQFLYNVRGESSVKL
jgi:hypothetical protein